jgi:hypothetical protein
MFFDSKECEWADVKVFIAGKELTKLRSVRYKTKKEKELLHAAGDKPISIQSGNRDNEGTIKILKGALDDLNRAAVSAGGQDVLDIAFDVVVTYRPKGVRALQTDTLVGVEITEFEKAMDQGAKSMEVELPIIFLDLICA